jgi:hypothetical protein
MNQVTAVFDLLSICRKVRILNTEERLELLADARLDRYQVR